MIRSYAAAQQGSPSAGHLLFIAVGFLLAGGYLVHWVGQWKGESPGLDRSVGQAAVTAFGRKAYLVCGWTCLAFGTLCLVSAVGIAVTG